MTRRLAAFSVVLFATVAFAGPGKKEANRAINDLRTAKDAKGRVAALMEIGKIGQVHTALVVSATDDVVKSLADKDPTVRAAAAECYGMLDPDPKTAVPALVKLLTSDDDVRVKTGVANGLAAIGPGAKEATPDLRKVQQEFNKKVRDTKMPTTPAERMALGLNRGVAQAAAAAITRINPPRKK